MFKQFSSSSTIKITIVSIVHIVCTEPFQKHTHTLCWNGTNIWNTIHISIIILEVNLMKMKKKRKKEKKNFYKFCIALCATYTMLAIGKRHLLKHVHMTFCIALYKSYSTERTIWSAHCTATHSHIVYHRYNKSF